MDVDTFAAEFPDEGHHTEWKRGVSVDRIEEAGVAFSNADGGVLLVGVEDDGTVVGRALTADVELQIHKAFGRAHGVGKYEIRSFFVDDQEVTVVSVSPHAKALPRPTTDYRSFAAARRTCRSSGEELFVLASKRTRARYEKSDTEVSLSRAAASRVELLRGAFGWSDDEELLDRLAEHDLVMGEGSPSLTVAGALYLLEDPTEIVGRASIEIYRFPSVDGEYDKRSLVTGPVDDQVRTVTEMVTSELRSELVVLGTHRHELARIPAVVLREAIANAVAHRQYQLRGVAIRIDIRPDRVVIESPGQLPEPVTVSNMREAQSARNSSVLRVLRRLCLAEDAGRGVDVMEDTMREELLDPPAFVETSHSVRVTLPLGSTVAPRERAWVREIERQGRIRPEDRILLIHAARGTILTNAYVREILGVDSVYARQALQRLRDAELLRQQGRRGGTQYSLAGGLAPPAGLRLGPEELQGVVLELAEDDGTLTNETVRERTGLDRAEAQRILNLLVERGDLERHGERRGTFYTLPGRLDELDLRPPERRE